MQRSTRPALSMSVPVCYNANTVVVDNGNNHMIITDDNSKSSTVTSEMHQHRLLSGGRLGTPDVASYNYNEVTLESELHKVQPHQVVEEAALTRDEIFPKLHEALSLEPKFQPSLYLPQESQDGEITIGARDGAAHVLRCLKVWYELSNDVLFAAINLVDRFLTKMKVRPKHMACISVTSLHLAVQQLGLPQIDPEDLVVISQCRCTSRDLERMAGIVANKLGVQMNTSPVTALTFIRLFYYVFKMAAQDLGLAEFYQHAISLSDLEMRLEILACDASCASIRASELALVLICTQMDNHVKNVNGEINQQMHGLVDYAIEIQRLCRIPDLSFFHSHSTVVKILSLYNGQHKMPYKQRLVWKLSSRTLRTLRPTDKLTSYLPTIVEHNANNNTINNNNLRFRTGSVSSEDGEDWPTSPVVAVCEQF